MNVYQDITHIEQDAPEIRARLARLKADADWLVNRPVRFFADAVGADAEVVSDAVIEVHLILRGLEI